MESVLSTDELHSRPSRLPNYQAENRALLALAHELADSPRNILQKLVEIALDLCQAGSAGVSLLSKKDSERTFYWPAIAGAWKPYVGSGTPRDFGPCGVVLDRDAGQLFKHPERYYPYLMPVTPPIEEAMLTPFYVGGKAVGTVWVISHDEQRKFDAEDMRQIVSLGSFASAAYKVWESLDAMEQTRAAIAESEARLRFMAETMPQKIFSARPNGEVDYFNQQWMEFTGLTFDQIKDWNWTGFIHPDDVEENVRVWQQSIDTGEPFQFEHRFRRADGEYRWHLSRANALQDAEGKVLMWIGSNTDIHDVKLAEEAIVGRSRLAALGADVGFALTQSDHLPEMLNLCAVALVRHLDVAFARIWTVNEEEEMLELQASAGMYTHLDGSHSRVPVGKFKIGLIASERTPHLTNDVQHDPRVSNKEWAEREGMIAFAGYPLLVDERLIGVVAMFARRPLSEETLGVLSSIVNGISLGIERKRTEEERNQLLVSEHAARVQADEANRLKDQFLATVSHELRTPLNAIMGWAHMLDRGSPDAETVARGVKVIERNAKAQNQLIADLLDVSRIISGKMRFEAGAVELISVIQAAMETVRPAAEAKGIELRTVLNPTAGLVSGDANRLQQIVWNLLANAIKYTPKGGRVEARLERQDTHIAIIVRDTGEGLSPEILPYIFDRFRQADGATTRQHGGLGLGLAIVRHLVEAHGGTVRAASHGASQGSTFTVTLPLIAVRGDEADAERADADEVPANSTLESMILQGLRVQVVDDEPDARELLTIVLKHRGAEVRASATAREAFEVLKEWKPDVLVSDIGMPGEDGNELIRKVRTLKAASGGLIPALALTGYASPADAARALESGYQMHLAKPVAPTELVNAVAGLAMKER